MHILYEMFKQRCIKSRSDSVVDITALAQKLFYKSLPVNTVHLKLYHAKRSHIYKNHPETLLSSCLGQNSFKIDWDKVRNCSVVRQIKIWKSVWKPWICVLHVLHGSKTCLFLLIFLFSCLICAVGQPTLTSFFFFKPETKVCGLTTPHPTLKLSLPSDPVQAGAPSLHNKSLSSSAKPAETQLQRLLAKSRDAKFLCFKWGRV